LTSFAVGSLLIAIVVYLDPNDLNDPRLLGSMGAILLALLLLIINRLGYLYWAAVGFIGYLTLLFLVPPYVMGIGPEFLAFAIVPMLLAGMFFPFRWTALLVVVIIGTVFLLNVLVPVSIETLWLLRMMWYFLCFGGAMILAFVNHVNKLEAIRRRVLEETNQKLRESESLLEYRVQERTRDLEVAGYVTRQATTLLDLEELLPVLVEHTCNGFGLYNVAVFLYNEPAQTLDFVAGAGQPQNLSEDDLHLAVDSSPGIIRRAAFTREVVWVNDVTRYPDYLPHPNLPETRSEMALPLLVGSKLVGVLDLQAAQVDYFSQDHLKIMKTLAEQFAIAIENAQLYADQVRVAGELRKLDTLKSQFLASMSHELRTPMNAILNFTEFMAMGMLGGINEQQKDALAKILGSGKHLLALINDVLDITKIEAGMMRLFVEEDVNLQHELAPVISTAETLLKDKPVTFIQEVEEGLPLLVGDKRRIRQILLNLISNAAKFTETGSIILRVRRQGEQVLFEVHDTGPGIALEDQEIIFEPFQQTETGIKHAGGTGLGLPISRRLAQAHGGALWVESEPGKGAAFFVTLPIRSETLLQMIEMPEA
jgi:signal transduction histidine kinase